MKPQATIFAVAIIQFPDNSQPQIISLPKYLFSIEQLELTMKRKYLIKHLSQTQLQKDNSLLNNSQQSDHCFRLTSNAIQNSQTNRIKTDGPEPRSISKQFANLQGSMSNLKKSKYFIPLNKQNSKNGKTHKHLIRHTYNECRVNDFVNLEHKNLDTTTMGSMRLSETRYVNKKSMLKVNARARYKVRSPTAVENRVKEYDQSFQLQPFKKPLNHIIHQPHPQVRYSSCNRDPSNFNKDLSNCNNSLVHCNKDIGLEDIIIQSLIGSGTFGKVFNARLKATGERIALKKVQQEKKYKTRQLQMLEMVDSPFLIKTFATFSTDQGKYNELNIAMQAFDQNFYQLLKVQNLTPIQTKCYIYQMLRGLLYMHSRGICHRDIKPQNMLVKNKRLVICDFGSAKVLRPGEQNVSYICSRCYRAPQLIFQTTHYTTQIDMWSLGCILLEILNDRPLFIADSSLNHILQVIKVLGTPSRDDVRAMNPNYDLSEYELPRIRPKSFKHLFPKTDLVFIDLIEKIVRYSPEKRLAAAEALAHQYFDELRNERVYRNIPYFQGLELFFDFQRQILPLSLRDKLVPKWCKPNKK